MEKEEFLKNLTRRYVNNEASDEELEVFFHFLETGELCDILKQSISEEAELQSQQECGLAYMEIAKPWYLKIHLVASILVLLTIGFAVFGYYKIRGAESVAVHYSKIITGNEEIKKVTLADGSVIWLNSSSTLAYPEKFSSGERVVKLLEGEAYFDIKHDKRPFVVFAGGARTNVLGTAFNIRSYKNLETVQITVNRGKVAVKNISNGTHQAQAVLLPNDQAVINRESGDMQKRNVKSWEISGWRQGDLYFNNERFADIAEMLEKRFNIKIEFIDKELKEYRFSAGFKSTEGLKDVLEILSLANGITYKKTNNIVQFTKKR